MKTKCPTCGRPYEQHTFESSQKLRNVAAAISPPAGMTGPPPGFSARRETPTYLPSTEAHIQIPFRQSVIFGLFKAPVGGFVAYSLAYLIDLSSKNVDLTIWGYIFVTGAGALVVGFWVASQKWESRLGFYDSLLWKVEEASQRDVDGDGHIGEPAHRVEVELRRNGKPWKFESLEISQERLIKLARAVAAGSSFANRTAWACGIPREEFEALRNKFVSRAWAEWKGKPGSNQGVRLTDEGIDIIAEIARTPLPRANRGAVDSMGRSHSPTPAHDLSGRYVPIEPK